MSKKTIKASQLFTRAMFEPSTINVEERTVEIVISTETPVKSYYREIGDFMEILSMEKGAVRMDRLNSGAPLLDNHDRYSGTKSVLGVVENARFEGKKLVGKIRFSNREDVKGTWQDVQDGILTGISTGYRVYAYELITPSTDTTLPVYKATDWEPMEVSIAPIQADVNSRVRNENIEEHEIVIKNLTINNNRMTEEEKKALQEAEIKRANDIILAVRSANLPIDFADKFIGDGSNVEAVRSAINVEVERIKLTEPKNIEAATLAERKRASEIKLTVRTAGLEDKIADEHIEKGTSIDAVRALVIEEMAKKSPTNGVGAQAKVGVDEADKVREVKIASLSIRAGLEIKDEALKSEAMKNRSMSLLDLAKESLTRSGVNIQGLDKMEIAKRALSSSTSDFPVLLEGTNRRVLLNAYASIPDTWRRFCTTGSVGDFREYKRLRMGTFGNLDAKIEGEEYKTKKIGDATSEKVSASTKGNMINVTREMIVNDDLDAFTRLASMLGRSAARSIESDVYALLAANPIMGDGIALFDAAHSNIGTGAALSVSSIDADRILMATQMDNDKNDFLDIRPSILLVPVGLGGAARVINQSQFDTEVSNKFQVPNRVAGLYRDIIDTPRLSGTTRYSFCDPTEEPVVEVSFLDGVQTPYLESEQTFDTDGMRWKIRLDYGVSAVGWRGVVRNAGA